MKLKKEIFKKAVLIALCFVAVLLLGSCKAKEEPNMEIKTKKAITVVNEVTDGDIWILANTEKNRKTTTWGEATAPDIKSGESRKVALCEAGDNGQYLFRMIDSEDFYYSSNSIVLDAGYTLVIKEDDNGQYQLVITDNNSDLTYTYSVFAAKL